MEETFDQISVPGADGHSGAAGEDRRAHRRYPTRLAGTVEVAPGVTAMVSVLDMSTGGALVRFPVGSSIPKSFLLMLGADDRPSTPVPCHTCGHEDHWTGQLAHVGFVGLSESEAVFVSTVIQALRPDYERPWSVD